MNLSFDAELRCVDLHNLTKDRKEELFTVHLTLDKVESILYDVNIKYKKVEIDDGIYLLRLMLGGDELEKYYVFRGDQTYLLLNAKEFNKELFHIYKKLAVMDKMNDMMDFDFKLGLDVQDVEDKKFEENMKELDDINRLRPIMLKDLDAKEPIKVHVVRASSNRVANESIVREVLAAKPTKRKITFS